jgi:anti-anti-sigma factor
VAALTFVDSCGIGALMQASNAAAVAGATLTLADPRPAVRRVLEVTGLAAHFGLAPNAT